MARTKVIIHADVRRKLEQGVAEGVLLTAQAGKERALEHARGKFKTIRRFERNAFAVAFDDGRRIGGDANAPSMPDEDGTVGYFGYDWFVARFYETGTVRQSPRPSLQPTATEMGKIMPNNLRLALTKRGF